MTDVLDTLVRIAELQIVIDNSLPTDEEKRQKIMEVYHKLNIKLTNQLAAIKKRKEEN